MEVELVTESLSEEAFGVDDNIDEYSTFEGERCGICMDTVIDRGVLDCCQHWFCFTCIDNWATITNLCPLCQSEFQLITCVPVYDTIGSNRVDEELYSRDDDWCIEGKNNTLSFPSYYIDENAVVCLDGDGCKIRSGSATMAEDCTLDTSIACDSCDIWYHALCVGFDPEGTCENSWLCPRCVVNGMPEKIEVTLTAKPDACYGPENANSNGLADVSFSGKVSVAVADTGETAVVISMVGGNHSVEESIGNIPSTLDVGNGLSADAEKSQSTADDCELGRAMSEIGPNLEEKSLKLSLSQETSFSSPSRLLTEQREYFAARGISEMTDGLQHSSRKLFQDDDDMSMKSGLDLHLGLSVGSCLSDVKNNNSQTAGDVHHKHRSEELLLTVDKIPDEKDNNVGTAGTRRKHRDRSADEGETKAETETKISRKKFKAESSRLIKSNDEAAEFVLDDPRKFAHIVADFKDGKPRNTSEKDAVSTDIMDIVRGPDCKALRRAQANAGAMSSKEENAAGLRIKKIMRRSAEDTESSMLVQKLRKEIREAVRNKSSKEFGERLFDPKLLAAFRAAVTGPINETPKSLPVDMKAKKLLLQKGKVRENLTKKIYGISGRRKRAWTRDCEIEFWKHRCSKISKPQKIETLRSVLNVLRKGPESLEIKQGNEGESTNSILSRLYLADTSVFPRKDDIKPLSSFHASENKVENKAENPMRKSFAPSLGNHFAKTASAQVSNNKETRGTVPSSKDEASCSKVYQNKSTEPSNSELGSFKTNSQDTSGKSDDIRSDKRKWALEVLARKSAVTSKNAVEEKQDSILQKGNYPLLAQLPADMRPVLAPSRHNKIPMSIRQAQLYRLTEHFLKKANLPVIRRTAETELAVADAVNIEREVADRSNSKLVYVNLCSQELLHRSDNKDKTTNINPSSTSPVSPEQLEVASVDLCSDSDVDEALRNAGLLSDSPPNSPHNQVEEIKAEVDTSKKLEPDVFEMDPHPELDIYGDFDYDLEDEYIMGASAFKTSRQQPEGESKMKVVFSTVNSDSLNGHLGFDNHESLESMDESKSSSSLLQGHESTMEKILPQTSSLDEEGEEPSPAECEELYGPDKEPLFNKFEGTSTKMSELAANIIDLARNEGGKFDQGVCSVGPVLNNCAENLNGAIVNHQGRSPNPYGTSENAPGNEKSYDKKSEPDSVSKKVEAYIKEHIRPLCKSGVITVDQYRWAVGKTTDKIMKYHSKDKSAKFLIKEGEKVKKLAEQYVEAAQQMGKNDLPA